MKVSGEVDRGSIDTGTGAVVEAIVRAAPDAIVAIDEARRIVMMNPAAERLFGCSTADARGRELVQFLPDGGNPGRVSGRRVDGTAFAAELTWLRAADEGGLAAPFGVLLRDVSAPHELQVELEHVQRHFGLVFDLAPVGLCVVDSDRIVAANQACENLFERRDGESLPGRTLDELLDAESWAQFSALLARALERPAGEPLVHEAVVGLAGRQRRLAVRLVALPDAGRARVQLMFSDVSHSSAERIELVQARHDLRRLTASVVQARENARLRIARELHDELGQRLSALKLDLASLDPASGRSAYRERVASMLTMLDDTMTSVRRIIADLRPLMLDDLGLNAAIDWLARESARRMGIDVKVKLGERDPAIDKDASVAVYRMVQEALTNVARHARATEVGIELREVGTELRLVVQDNGVGFDPEALRKTPSFGLFGIRERAYALGGTMESGSRPGGGARLCVRLPLRRAHEGPAWPGT